MWMWENASLASETKPAVMSAERRPSPIPDSSTLPCLSTRLFVILRPVPSTRAFAAARALNPQAEGAVAAYHYMAAEATDDTENGHDVLARSTLNSVPVKVTAEQLGVNVGYVCIHVRLVFQLMAGRS
jgi:hypothetical protein